MLKDAIQGTYCEDDKQIWHDNGIHRVWTGEKTKHPPMLYVVLRSMAEWVWREKNAEILRELNHIISEDYNQDPLPEVKEIKL